MTPVRRAVLQARAILRRHGERTPPRDYRPGGDTRAIDWSASARAGLPLMRERRRDEPLAWSAIVDRSSSMDVGRRRALAVAAWEAVHFWRSCADAHDRWVELPERGHPFGLRDSCEVALKVLPAHAALIVAGDFHQPDTLAADMLRKLAQRFDCTALIADDPWRHDLAMNGFVQVSDIESGRRRHFFVGRRQRARYARAVRARLDAIRRLLRCAGWRASFFDESGGTAGVLRAFRLA